MTSVIRWSPISDLMSLHTAMDRLFGDAFGVSAPSRTLGAPGRVPAPRLAAGNFAGTFTRQVTLAENAVGEISSGTASGNSGQLGAVPPK
ncbi:MAG: hypothetical protein M3Z28_04505 [Candidatus Dormibacteraeota bacterium]|nr:hypothetical protein [Candidatus Dormibacteraeota bacterium]